MEWETKKFIGLGFVEYSLYCGGLQPSLYISKDACLLLTCGGDC